MLVSIGDSSGLYVAQSHVQEICGENRYKKHTDMKTYKVTDHFVTHFVYLVLVCVVMTVYSLLITCLYFVREYELAKARQVQQFANIINDASK